MIAGAVLAAIAVPEQIAIAHLAGMPPEAGLYAFAAGSVAFAIFGANRFVSVGADSTIVPIFVSAVAAVGAHGSPQYAAEVALVALMSGVFLIVAGVAQIGWIADLLSIPVTVGFLAGIAVHVIAGQLPLLLGLPPAAGSLIAGLADIGRDLPAANGYALWLGLATLGLTLGLGRANPRLPAPLIALALAGAAVDAFRLRGRGVLTLGALPAHLPHVALPSLADSAGILPSAPVSLVIALVCMVQTAAVLRSPDTEPAGEEEDPADTSRDFAAVGAGSIVAACIGGFAVNVSPPRTATARASGGRSQLSGLFAVAIVAVVVSLASGLTVDVPQAGLGAVLISIGLRIFRWRDIARIARRAGYEIALVAGSALLVIVFSIETGMVLSIILSLIHGIYIIARPPSVELVRVAGTTIWWPRTAGAAGTPVPRAVVFAPAAPITFTNAHYIIDKLERVVAASPGPPALVVIECSGVLDIDYTGAIVLAAAVARLRAAHTDVAIARLIGERAAAAANRTGLIAAIGANHVYKSVYEAIAAFGLPDMEA